MSDFVPKQYKKDPITIRVDFEKLETIDRCAAQYNLSRSEFINQCIDYALDHLPDLRKQRAVVLPRAGRHVAVRAQASHQKVERGVQLVHARLGRRAAAVLLRLLHQRAVCRLDLVLARAVAQTERCVCLLFCHFIVLSGPFGRLCPAYEMLLGAPR